MDRTILVRCNYDSVEFFKGGVAKVKIGEGWGIINQAGCQILPCIYNSIEILGPYFDKTYLYVKDDSTDKYGLFNSIGLQIIPFILESEYEIEFIHQNFITVSTTVVTEESCIVENAYFDGYGYSGEAYIPEKTETIYGLFNISGKKILEILYGYISIKSENLIFVSFSEFISRKKGYGLFDFNGNEVIIPDNYIPKLVLSNNLIICYKNNEGVIFQYNFGEILKSDYKLTKSYIKLDQKVFEVTKFNKVGFLNIDGGEIITCNLNDVSYFDGWKLLIQSENLKFGLIEERTADEILPPVYDTIEKFKDSIIKVMIENYWYYLDLTKMCLLSAKNKVIARLNELYYKIEADGKIGLIDKRGNIIISNIWDDIIPILKDYFLVKKDKHFGVQAINNIIVLQCIYESISWLGNDIWLIKKNGLLGIIVSNGQIILEPIYVSIKFIEPNLFIVSNQKYSYSLSTHNKFALINVHKKLVADFLYSNIEHLVGDLFKAEIELYLIIDANGQKLSDCIYTNINLKKDYIVAYKLDGFIDIFDLNGLVISNSEFTYISNTIGDFKIVSNNKENKMTDKFSLISSSKQIGFFNIKTQFKINCIYDKVEIYEENTAKILLDGKWGLINTEGHQVIDCIYDSIRIFSNKILATVSKQKKYSIINIKNNKVIFPFIFEGCFEINSEIIFLEHIDKDLSGFMGLNNYEYFDYPVRLT